MKFLIYVSAAFTPKRYTWSLFLLEAESTPESYCGRKNEVNKKSYLYKDCKFYYSILVASAFSFVLYSSKYE